jgi:signal transduction histidine kinase
VQEVYRSEETGITLNRTSFNVTALLQEAVDGIRPEANRKNIILKYELPDAAHLPPLLADRSKLLRVISNLLTNAVKFTSKGGVVMLNAAVVNGMGVNIGRDFIEISVTDTGIGIPPEDLPYVFDVYRQSRNNRSGVGVGLGLSIVKSIVAAHGGDVRVESQPGVGTSFTVSLPISAVDEPPEAPPSDCDQTPNPTAAGTGPAN